MIIPDKFLSRKLIVAAISLTMLMSVDNRETKLAIVFISLTHIIMQGLVDMVLAWKTGKISNGENDKNASI